MPDVAVVPADPDDHEVLERLWLLFRHDMSEFDQTLPNADGSYRRDRLVAAFEDRAWQAYLIKIDSRPVGLVIVRSLDRQPYVLNSFFIVRGARRSGYGTEAVRQVVARHPGVWEVAFQQRNPTAAAFWRKIAIDLVGDDWSEEDRPVPDRPDLAPDSWITFSAECSP